MEFPELIFIFIFFIVVGYLIWNIKNHRQKNNFKKLIRNTTISMLIIGFSWIWFVPIYIGQRGESPVCKFRFQVFEYNSHDYSGYGNFSDLFIKTFPNKYGSIEFHSKIGGVKEYFGLKSFEYETEEQYFGKEKKLANTIVWN